MYKVTKSFQLFPELNSKMLAVGTIIECSVEVYNKFADSLEPCGVVAKPTMQKPTKKKAVSTAFEDADKRSENIN